MKPTTQSTCGYDHKQFYSLLLLLCQRERCIRSCWRTIHCNPIKAYCPTINRERERERERMVRSLTVLLLASAFLASLGDAASSTVGTIPIRENGMLRGPVEDPSSDGSHRRRQLWGGWLMLLST